MNNLSEYIVEKLRIGKNTKIVYSVDEESIVNILNALCGQKYKSIKEYIDHYRLAKDIYDWAIKYNVTEYEIYVNKKIDTTPEEAIEDEDKVKKYMRYFRKKDICAETNLWILYLNDKGLYTSTYIYDYNLILLIKND